MGRLTGKYAIVGVGETVYTRSSGRTIRAMGTEAWKNAMLDAGLLPQDIDGAISYAAADACTSWEIAAGLGIQLNWATDCMGGGSSTEALITLAIGAIEQGMCHTVVVYRSMNGYTQVRIGGTGSFAIAPIDGQGAIGGGVYGMRTAAQAFAPSTMRYMRDFGLTNTQLAHVKVAHSNHANNNPKAYYKERVTVEDVLNSRWIVKPFHLLDCCVETDNAAALIITDAERASNLRRPPVYILGVSGRTGRAMSDYHWNFGPIYFQPQYWATQRAFALAGVSYKDVDVTQAYDAFTWTSMIQLEFAGYCERGTGGEYVSSGVINLGGARPNNTSGGHLCEAYTHGIQHVIENVRQLRWQVDDYCLEGDPGDRRPGKHSYDYSEKKCRQVPEPWIAHNMGWAQPAQCSSMVLGRLQHP